MLVQSRRNGCTENRLPRLAIIDEEGAKVRIADRMHLGGKELVNILNPVKDATIYVCSEIAVTFLQLQLSRTFSTMPNTMP